MALKAGVIENFGAGVVSPATVDPTPIVNEFGDLFSVKHRENVSVTINGVVYTDVYTMTLPGSNSELCFSKGRSGNYSGYAGLTNISVVKFNDDNTLAQSWTTYSNTNNTTDAMKILRYCVNTVSGEFFIDGNTSATSTTSYWTIIYGLLEDDRRAITDYAKWSSVLGTTYSTITAYIIDGDNWLSYSMSDRPSAVIRNAALEGQTLLVPIFLIALKNVQETIKFKNIYANLIGYVQKTRLIKLVDKDSGIAGYQVCLATSNTCEMVLIDS